MKLKCSILYRDGESFILLLKYDHVCTKYLINQHFSTGCHFASQVTFDGAWGHFWSSKLEQGGTGGVLRVSSG